MAGHQRSSSTMRSLLLVAAVIPFSRAQSSTVTCFGFNGGNYTGNVPCPGSNACCGFGATGLSNRICSTPTASSSARHVASSHSTKPARKYVSSVCFHLRPLHKNPTNQFTAQTNHPPAVSSPASNSAPTAASAAPPTPPAANAASASSSTSLESASTSGLNPGPRPRDPQTPYPKIPV
jgi:hypothetical protein